MTAVTFLLACSFEGFIPPGFSKMETLSGRLNWLVSLFFLHLFQFLSRFPYLWQVFPVPPLIPRPDPVWLKHFLHNPHFSCSFPLVLLFLSDFLFFLRKRFCRLFSSGFHPYFPRFLPPAALL